MFLGIQINYLLWLQHLRELTNGAMDAFFISITNFGEILIPLLFVSCIYWAFNRKIGEFLLLAHSLILVCCQFLKMIFCIKRPWLLNPAIKPVKAVLPTALGYSFPSGHTACAMGIWGGLATVLWDKKLVRYTLMILIFLVAFSRNYLGVHTPQDVIASVLVGIIILWIMNKTFYNKDNEPKYFAFGIGLVISISAIIILKSYILTGSFGEVMAMKCFITYMTYALGTIFGWYLCKYAVPFETTNCGWRKRFLRTVFGITTLICLFEYCKPYIIGSSGNIGAGAIASCFIGFYITMVYPWLFTKIENKIAQSQQNSDKP